MATGRFTGDLEVVWLDDGRGMRLTRDFGFVDPDGQTWEVPAGAQTDGASIPRPLWAVVGSPFTDKYRKAAVVHDYFCDVRTRTSEATHRAFFYAMLTEGLARQMAKIMYLAVLYAGPRWNGQAVANANLSAGYAVPGGRTAGGSDAMTSGGGGEVLAELDVAAAKPGLLRSPELQQEDLDRFNAEVEAQDLDVGQIEALAATARSSALAGR